MWISNSQFCHNGSVFSEIIHLIKNKYDTKVAKSGRQYMNVYYVSIDWLTKSFKFRDVILRYIQIIYPKAPIYSCVVHSMYQQRFRYSRPHTKVSYGTVHYEHNPQKNSGHLSAVLLRVMFVMTLAVPNIRSSMNALLILTSIIHVYPWLIRDEPQQSSIFNLFPLKPHSQYTEPSDIVSGPVSLSPITESHSGPLFSSPPNPLSDHQLSWQ